MDVEATKVFKYNVILGIRKIKFISRLEKLPY